MKNFLNFTLLALPMIHFSFWKMEGPYCIKTYKENTRPDINPESQPNPNLDQTSRKRKKTKTTPTAQSQPNPNLDQFQIEEVILVNKPGNGSVYKNTHENLYTANYLLNYNHKLGYSIVYPYVPSLFDKESKNLVRQALRTLRGHTDFTNSSLSFYAVKGDFGKDIHNWTSNNNNFLRKALADTNTPKIKIQKEFISSSGISIINQEGKVEIKKGNTVLNFEEKLISYFSKNNPDNKQANKQANNKVKTSKVIDSQIYKTFRIQEQASFFSVTDNQELQLLQNSTILAVYGVLKGNTNKNSVLWGVAKDKKTEKLFHWITDIQNDISTLF